MLPFVRAFISIVAGLVRVPAGRFGVLSLIGTVIYVTALSTAGYALGSSWNSVSHGLAVVGYVLFALVVIAVVGFVAYRLRAFRREARRQSAGAGAGAGAVADVAAEASNGAGTPRVAGTPRAPGAHRAGRSDR
jgi:uncharacterized membrane protein